MMSRFVPTLVALCLSACGLVDALSPETPDIPDDYPQLGEFESARIDVVIDGTPLDDTGYCSYDDSGIDEDKLRFDLDVDFLDLEVREREEGEYSSAAGEVEASWSESGSFHSSASCGESVVRFDGERGYEGISGDEIATWGTVQLVLCDDAGERVEVSGKFSCALG